MNQDLKEQIKHSLTAEKERLEKELSSFAVKNPRVRDDWNATFPAVASEAGPLSHSAEDEQADIREEFETELAQEQSLELRLREVNRALDRAETDSFGVCKTCGKPIPEERLVANPAAEYDMEHQPRDDA